MRKEDAKRKDGSITLPLGPFQDADGNGTLRYGRKEESHGSFRSRSRPTFRGAQDASQSGAPLLGSRTPLHGMKPPEKIHDLPLSIVPERTVSTRILGGAQRECYRTVFVFGVEIRRNPVMASVSGFDSDRNTLHLQRADKSVPFSGRKDKSL